MAELKKYNTEATFYFPLVIKDDADYDPNLDGSLSFDIGDVQVNLDGTTFTNSINLPEHIGNGIYKLILDATEMTAAHIVITIISQNTPKDFEDQSILVDTFGNASAALPFDLSSSLETQLTTILMSDLAQGNPAYNASIIYAINFLYEMGRNKTETTATELAIFKDDGTTKAFKSTIGDSAGTFTKGEFSSGA